MTGTPSSHSASIAHLLDEADRAEVRRVHAQDRAGVRVARRALRVVGQARAVGRPDLDEPRAGLGDDLGDAEAAADLDELAARDDDLAPGGERRGGQQRRAGAVVDDERRLGARELAQQALDVGVARAARAAPRGRARGSRSPRRRGRPRRGRPAASGARPRFGVDDDAGRVEDPPQRRAQAPARAGEQVGVASRAPASSSARRTARASRAPRAMASRRRWRRPRRPARPRPAGRRPAAPAAAPAPPRGASRRGRRRTCPASWQARERRRAGPRRYGAHPWSGPGPVLRTAFKAVGPAASRRAKVRLLRRSVAKSGPPHEGICARMVSPLYPEIRAGAYRPPGMGGRRPPGGRRTRRRERARRAGRRRRPRGGPHRRPVVGRPVVRRRRGRAGAPAM